MWLLELRWVSYGGKCDFNMAKISRKYANDGGSGSTWNWVNPEVLNTKSIINTADLIPPNSSNQTLIMQMYHSHTAPSFTVFVTVQMKNNKNSSSSCTRRFSLI
ncbi:hypothetical protein PIB30_069338 [Stylosanthes scabra]|uniref:Uncharacterized protein n=1 Tax=Stylosanthes scabra TaxID=79078 RepID=A0ABU6TQI7_9FABA|nr:hypothetical protein [Stylosanthes scabra]